MSFMSSVTLGQCWALNGCSVKASWQLDRQVIRFHKVRQVIRLLRVRKPGIACFLCFAENEPNITESWFSKGFYVSTRHLLLVLPKDNQA